MIGNLMMYAKFANTGQFPGLPFAYIRYAARYGDAWYKANYKT